ncbi:hypothetical protein [Haladaptatus caseinilyticus]|uniref:hypothetical protein n=1 Tax=Haladaptatus caseinilyticus TaxID=2993314 RepID=UPI00224B3E7F|nr:hypothetical protein [Haladaptatus caseinilyticus]
MSLEITCYVDTPGLPVVPTAVAVPSTTVELDRVLIVGDDPPALVLWIDRTPDELATLDPESVTQQTIPLERGRWLFVSVVQPFVDLHHRERFSYLRLLIPSSEG